MHRASSTPDLDVDLQGGMVPISKVASSLAALIKRGRERRQPIIVTQKGYPTGVILPIELYVALREMAERNDEAREAPPPPQADEPEPAAAPTVAPPADPPPAPAQPGRPRARRGAKAAPPGAPEPAAALAPPAEIAPTMSAATPPAPVETGKPRRGGRKAQAQA